MNVKCNFSIQAEEGLHSYRPFENRSVSMSSIICYWNNGRHTMQTKQNIFSNHTQIKWFQKINLQRKNQMLKTVNGDLLGKSLNLF